MPPTRHQNVTYSLQYFHICIDLKKAGKYNIFTCIFVYMHQPPKKQGRHHLCTHLWNLYHTTNRPGSTCWTSNIRPYHPWLIDMMTSLIVMMTLVFMMMARYKRKIWRWWPKLVSFWTYFLLPDVWPAT